MPQWQRHKGMKALKKKKKKKQPHLLLDNLISAFQFPCHKSSSFSFCGRLLLFLPFTGQKCVFKQNFEKVFRLKVGFFLKKMTI
jgi:hypothetical protein